jgi:hypothetical protein
MQTAHTPTPWTVQHSGEGYPLIAGPESPDWGTEARYDFIATLLPHPSNLYSNGKHRTRDGIAEREANAAFIVLAVNSHAALVEALEAVRQVIDHGEAPRGFPLSVEVVIADDLVAVIDAAIARAKGQP